MTYHTFAALLLAPLAALHGTEAPKPTAKPSIVVNGLDMLQYDRMNRPSWGAFAKALL